MKATLPFVALGVLVLGVATASAQVIPTTPKKFGKRPLTGTGSSGGTVGISGGSTTPASTKVRYTSHIALSQARQWQSSDGKSLLGKLLAFEDMTVETEKGAPVPAFTPPANPTVVKGGNVRLLVASKMYVLPLDRLSQADRDFVEKVRDAVAKRAAAAPAPAPAPGPAPTPK